MRWCLLGWRAQVVLAKPSRICSYGCSLWGHHSSIWSCWRGWSDRGIPPFAHYIGKHGSYCLFKIFLFVFLLLHNMLSRQDASLLLSCIIVLVWIHASQHDQNLLFCPPIDIETAWHWHWRDNLSWKQRGKRIKAEIEKKEEKNT